MNRHSWGVVDDKIYKCFHCGLYKKMCVDNDNPVPRLYVEYSTDNITHQLERIDCTKVKHEHKWNETNIFSFVCLNCGLRKQVILTKSGNFYAKYFSEKGKQIKNKGCEG